MRFIEVTDSAVRTTALRLARPDSPLEFLIFPMVHIGDASFYADVTDLLGRTDLIVAEGVGRPEDPPPVDPTLHWPGLELEDLRPARPRASLAGLAISASYRLAARFDRLGLVEQDIDYDALGVPVLCPDMTDREFAAGWREVPAWQRTVMMVTSPLAGLQRLALGSRRTLAAGLAGVDTLEAPPGYEKMVDLIGAQRDRLLMTAVEAVHEVHSGDPLTVAVVYGALHVPPLIEGLRERYGYRVRDADRLTVFTLE